MGFVTDVTAAPTASPTAAGGDIESAERAFSKSILVSAVRCTLTYVLIPFVFPIIGFGTGVGPWIGLPISLIAIVAIVMSIRRFWRADHSKRWHYTVLGTTVIGFLIYLVVKDIVELLG